MEPKAALQEIEEILGNNLQWLTDALDLPIRQGNKETIQRLAEIERAWKIAVLAKVV